METPQEGNEGSASGDATDEANCSLVQRVFKSFFPKRKGSTNRESSKMTIEEALDTTYLKGNTDRKINIKINVVIAQGLANYFPFGKHKVSMENKFVMVLDSRLHIALDLIKYQDILDIVSQIIISLTIFAFIQTRQPIFCLPLKIRIVRSVMISLWTNPHQI